LSSVQKGPTWLPKFWRKADPVHAAVEGETLKLNPDPGDAPSAPAPTAAGLPPRIHPLACVDPRAQLANDVEVGPFCVIGPDVAIAAGTKLLAHVTVMGQTTIGTDNVIYPNAVLGAPPQDKKFKGENTRLEIGNQNHIREGVTLHTGTVQGGGLTRIGNNNLLMVGTHLGHDVFVGDNCVMANTVMIAGHVHVKNNVVLSGCVGIHHFVTVNDYVYASGMIKITHDVPPYVKIDEGDRIRAVNSLGLRRNGFSEDDISAVEQAIFKLFLDRKRPPQSKVVEQLTTGEFAHLGANPHVQRVLEAMRLRSLHKHGRYLESLRNA
jgi:UDP-N-acetylglucosamine acyltransferase